ncbi:MAG: hypothetical protein FJY75_00720 [Candidatus Eisenbacteria bacterium]|uniref:Uncharacterized protein n=1 Tax=Eiseniibacteriota bacterium TaxID=2212470 RepID=A0A938BPZ1_UNCEI|nr:hypothetical protein [Candidatus Eisenbacteria bacterium]
MIRADASRLRLALLLAAAAAALFAGWKLLWFLTDDAYIAFRYISNARLGYGYVWNAPPFSPVEGYTSFLWVVLLDLVWRVLGVEPPAAANTLALLFALATLALTARMVWRLTWTQERERLRLPLLALTLAGLVSHRTFITWSSSGLETAMFNALVAAWVYAAGFLPAGSRRRPLAIAGAAAALCLTRPDGLLFALATLPIVWLALPGSSVRERARGLWALAPLAVVPTHLLWRRAFYGAWLPNTYYAKYTGPWPESGWRYAASFVLEYALWVWLALALAVLLPRWPMLRERLRAELRGGGGRDAGSVRAAAKPAASATAPGRGAAATPASGGPALAWTLVALALLAHLLYYTLVIGGDHFEYRVYSHIVPLSLVAFVWMLNLARIRPRASLALMAAAVLLALPVPWTHWAQTRRLETREETFLMRAPVAPHWPAAARWYARTFDALQDWLINRFVCVRHQEHRVLHRFEVETYPTRAEGSRIGPDGQPVLAELAVGVPAWVLPRVHIIDLWGLNDHVIARSDRITAPKRQMAHDREPPEGYVECFQPNVFLAGPRRMQVFRREPQLTPQQIAACEAQWRAWLRQRPTRTRSGG